MTDASTPAIGRRLIEKWRKQASDRGYEPYAQWAFNRCADELDAALRACADALAPAPDIVLDAKRYRRLQILGAAPGGSKQLDKGTVLCFTNLDAFVDDDLRVHASRGEAKPLRVDALAPPEPPKPIRAHVLCCPKSLSVPVDRCDCGGRDVLPRPPRADALEASWHTAALLKDRTRRVIRERCQAGEAHQAIAADYGVPEAFVTHLAQWQMGADALAPQEPKYATDEQVKASAARMIERHRPSLEKLAAPPRADALDAPPMQCKFCGIDVDNGFACGGNGGGLHLMVRRATARDASTAVHADTPERP